VDIIDYKMNLILPHRFNTKRIEYKGRCKNLKQRYDTKIWHKINIKIQTNNIQKESKNNTCPKCK